MFDEKKKRPAKLGPLERNKEYKQVSSTVLFSCYVASAAIIVIAVSEAIKSFGASDSSAGAFYIALAVLGAAFSVFITLMNNRNKKLIAQGKTQKTRKLK